MEEFDRLLGLDRIQLVHVNDCKRPCGSRVDRHAHIGAGTIGLTGFRSLMQDERLVRVPKILETPKGDEGDMDRINLTTLRQLSEKNS